MSIRDQWIKLSPGVTTKKTNKTITIPAFSAACGPTLHSLFYNPVVSYLNAVNTGVSTIDSMDLSTAFTIEMMIKPFGPIDSTTRFLYCLVDGVLNPSIKFYLVNNKLNIRVYKGGIQQSNLASDSTITTNEWQHVAATYDGTTIKLYVDGSVQATTQAMASPIDAATSAYNLLGVNLGPDNPFSGYIGEFRIWTVCRTLDQIQSSMFSHRKTTDTGLKRYYKFGEAEFANYALNSVDGHQMVVGTSADTFVYITDNDYPPLKYGASFIAERVTCTSDGPSSLVFPVVAPEDANHCLCVSWLDGEDTIRRKLYSADSDIGVEDIAPNPPDYKGEVLPDTFYLEYWSVDGMPTVDLDSDFTIQTSHTRNPEHGYDHSIAADFTPVASSALAVAFPATFPLTFSAQQTYS